MEKVNVYNCNSNLTINKSVGNILKKASLPKSKKALIFIKPNFNSDMIALTGNTTDLRIIVSLIKILKKRGYENIVIGDGTSTGFYNKSIDVLSRLGVRAIGKRFGIKIIDLNYEDYRLINFGKYKIKIAKICLKCDYFINIPKIKTHAEAYLSACLKNLIGCVVGHDKQKVHKDFFLNILKLNNYIKPDLHIIDGIVSMEGTGPSKGSPIHTNLLISGTNPYLLDLLCCKIIGRKFKDIPYLSIAYSKGFFGKKELSHVKKIRVKKFNFKLPKPNFMARLINHPRYRTFFVKVRYAPLLFNLLQSKPVGRILNFIGIRQDVFIDEDSLVSGFKLNKSKCKNCNSCKDLCPLNYDLPKEVGKKCINCYYCYFGCPNKAISLLGEEGYLKYQAKNYFKRLL